jgi:hypothetical protein
MTTTHAVRKTNPKSRWPFRVVRFHRSNLGNIVSQHKLIARKFKTREVARIWLESKTANGTIARLT